MTSPKNNTFLSTKKVLLGAACLFMVIAGTGCGEDEPPPEIPELTKGIVITQPTDTDIFNTALDACESGGHEGLMHYDKETQETTIYCAFTETTGCGVLAYHAGACGPGNAVALPARASLGANIRTCDTSEKPVCGEDNNTYVNECIAALQQIVVKKDGVCDPADNPVLIKDIETVKKQIASSGGSSSSGNSGSTGSRSSGGSSSSGNSGGSDSLGGGVNPDRWVPFLVTIMASPNTRGGARIEKCRLGSRTIYYQQDSCPECFSTLYDRGGNVMCYPHNDITNTCPSSFDKNNRTSCELLWSKK